MLARVLKFCWFLQNLKKVSPPHIDKDYFNFKQDLEKDIRNEERRGELLLTCRIIHQKSAEIMATAVQPDFLEARGFRYNASTFGDLFGTGWANTFSKDDDGVSSSSEEVEQPEPAKNEGFGEELETGEPLNQDIDSADAYSSEAEPEADS